MADVTTYGDAKDAIILAVQAAWAANAPAIISPAPSLIIPGLHKNVNPEDAAPPPNFARLYVTHISGDQRSFGAVDGRMFIRTGMVLVQVFCANGGGEGYRRAIDLAEVAKNAIEGTNVENVWFRRAACREIGSVASYYQANATAEFEWTEVK